MKASPFLVAVNASGLPNSIPPQPATGLEAIGGLTMQQVAKYFWMLHSLTVHYAYVIDGVGSYGADYIISPSQEPLDRLATSPSFSYEFLDETSSIARQLQFEPSIVYEDSEGSYAFNFLLKEWTYPDGEILLTTQPNLPGYYSLDTQTFDLFGITLSLSLTSTYNDLTGSIQSITIETTYWEIDATATRSNCPCNGKIR
ncbi:MAG: hypothetical protein LBG86_00735 [Puniceicoccales bacterium]|jgi:hypothetical protein|nr:hypothetical protein [Puniceicoccales bacterium]